MNNPRNFLLIEGNTAHQSIYFFPTFFGHGQLLCQTGSFHWKSWFLTAWLKGFGPKLYSEMTMFSLLWIRFSFFFFQKMDEVIQIIVTSFIFAFFLEHIKKINLLPILKMQKSMNAMYRFSFSKSCQTKVTWVVIVTPSICIPFISLLKLLYLPIPINRLEFLMSTSFKAISACSGSKLSFQWLLWFQSVWEGPRY